jgi:hypothetical protein
MKAKVYGENSALGATETIAILISCEKAIIEGPDLAAVTKEMIS